MVICATWRAIHRAPHIHQLDVRVPAGWSYGYKAFTKGNFRGKGIYPAIAHAELDTCSNLGLTRGISITDVGNRASESADGKLGNARVGLAGFVKMGKYRFRFRSRSVRKTGFDFIPSTE